MLMDVHVDSHSFCFAVDTDPADSISVIEKKIMAEIVTQFGKAVKNGKMPATITVAIGESRGFREDEG